MNKLRKLKINVCVHIINGLPGETYEMMLETAKAVGQLDIQALKIHMLYVIEKTKLHQLYLQQPFKILSRDCLLYTSIPNFLANSQSRSSCAGTAIIAPVP